MNTSTDGSIGGSDREGDWLRRLVERTGNLEEGHGEDTAFTARVLAGLPASDPKAPLAGSSRHGALIDLVLASIGAGAAATVMAAHPELVASLFESGLSADTVTHLLVVLAPLVLMWGFSYLAFDSLRPAAS